jgi:hypothetical protein
MVGILCKPQYIRLMQIPSLTNRVHTNVWLLTQITLMLIPMTYGPPILRNDWWQLISTCFFISLFISVHSSCFPRHAVSTKISLQATTDQTHTNSCTAFRFKLYLNVGCNWVCRISGIIHASKVILPALLTYLIRFSYTLRRRSFFFSFWSFYRR